MKNNEPHIAQQPNQDSGPSISPLAGQPAPASLLVDVPKLVSAYYTEVPGASVPAQRVSFGTSGHRGSSFQLSFNEAHVLAITQAICNYRAWNHISGPLFMGLDTHALSEPASITALEVLAANGVQVRLALNDEYTPTPAVSLAIVMHNLGHEMSWARRADGIVITPSHNPPDSGGYKYNTPSGGPANQATTAWIEAAANSLLENGLQDVKRMPHAQALKAATTGRYDFLGAYVAELDQVVDMAAIAGSKLHLGVDPLGGAGVHYWARIAEHYRLDLSVINQQVDPTFAFMRVDWDGQIRMDPSSPYAMQGLVDQRAHYDMILACDTDHDRHGVVTSKAGLLPPNHYLSVMIDELFRSRPQWSAKAAIGKTVVSTHLIDLIGQRLGRRVYEVPVGFKWFADGLQDGSLGFAGEESAGASFLRRNGQVWTTDKDGMSAALLAAEITAHRGRDLGELYRDLAQALGDPVADRLQAPATAPQRAKLAALRRDDIQATHLAGELITGTLDKAPGNDAPISGIKVSTATGWFAARPSGTEDIYKIYAESFSGPDHLQRILSEAQVMVDHAIGGSTS